MSAFGFGLWRGRGGFLPGTLRRTQDRTQALRNPDIALSLRLIPPPPPAPASSAKFASSPARARSNRTTPATYVPRRPTRRRRWRLLLAPATVEYSRRSTPAAPAPHWPSCESTARTTCRIRAPGCNSPAGRFPITTTSQLTPAGRFCADDRISAAMVSSSTARFSAMSQRLLQSLHLGHRGRADVDLHAGRLGNRIHRGAAANDSNVERSLRRRRNRRRGERFDRLGQNHNRDWARQNRSTNVRPARARSLQSGGCPGLRPRSCRHPLRRARGCKRSNPSSAAWKKCAACRADRLRPLRPRSR